MGACVFLNHEYGHANVCLAAMVCPNSKGCSNKCEWNLLTPASTQLHTARYSSLNVASSVRETAAPVSTSIGIARSSIVTVTVKG